MTKPTARAWIIDTILGVSAGAIVGAIVAVNVVIYAGPDSGYQSSIADVFEHNIAVGLAAVTSLALGPLVGVAIARRMR